MKVITYRNHNSRNKADPSYNIRLKKKVPWITHVNVVNLAKSV